MSTPDLILLILGALVGLFIQYLIINWAVSKALQPTNDRLEKIFYLLKNLIDKDK